MGTVVRLRLPDHRLLRCVQGRLRFYENIQIIYMGTVVRLLLLDHRLLRCAQAAIDIMKTFRLYIYRHGSFSAIA